MPRTPRDDLGAAVPVPARAARLVSLVPSLTETVAASGGAERLVGVTDWCTHPPEVVARTPRVGGTKNPDVDRVLGLGPDLVLANEEENRAADVAALRAAGVPVWVTAPRSVPAALTSLGRLLAVLGLVDGARGWYRAAVTAWPVGVPPVREQALVPIWRRPWMALGSDTFAGDVLARLGVGNVLAAHPERYPRIDPAGVAAELVVLPDEPYRFAAEDAAAFPGRRVAFVSGRHLTWYGPSLAEAPAVLRAQLGYS